MSDKDQVLALRVPEEFRYVDRAQQRASDWIEYRIHAGVYPISYTTGQWHSIPGETRAQVDAYAAEHHPWARPYYGWAELVATKTRSYHENQLLWAVSGHDRDHDEAATVRWTPYAYELKAGATAYHEWTGKPGNLTLVHHAEVVLVRPCGEHQDPAGRLVCTDGCNGAPGGDAELVDDLAVLLDGAR